MSVFSCGRRVLLVVSLILGLVMTGCATFSAADAPVVKVAGLEPLLSEGLEFRFMLKLRIQNPNEEPIVFDGVAVELDLDGRGLANGVSSAKGQVPRFGELVVEVPVTVSAFAAFSQLFSQVSKRGARNATDTTNAPGVRYLLRGKLGGGGRFNAIRFSAEGDLLPGSVGALKR